MRGDRRESGFAPLEDYGLLSDGRTAALVAIDGSIDWWPVPTLDSPPVCAAILDPDRGGLFVLAPEGPFEVTRRYIEATNVIESVFRTPSGSVRVTDALNLGRTGPLPWTELARRIEALEGEVTLRWRFAPGDRFGQARPWVSSCRGTNVLHLGDQMLAVILCGAHEVRAGAHELRGRLRCPAGATALVAVTASDAEPLTVPAPDSVLARIDTTVRSWQTWATTVSADGRWRDVTLRSALTIKALVQADSGALAAAATTSLPEAIGGTRNWDYRYAWVRDSSFAVDAAMCLGLHEEVHATISWLLGALRRSAPTLRVFYQLEGDPPGVESELPVPGYRHSRPARSGNGASGQRQLGAYGDLFDTVFRFVSAGHLLDKTTASVLAELADRCCDTWQRPDSGIWELADLQHYTISKIGCWVTFDRAARLAVAGHLPELRVDRWRTEAEEVKAWVYEHCWSPEKGSFAFFAGTDRLDAATLLAARTGFDTGDRLAGTVDAVRRELGRGPLLYRYSGMEAEEGAFLACSFWLVEALCRLGRRDEAVCLMDESVELANDLGLLSEEIDPESGALLGNMPQALSHLALVNAAHAIGEGER